MIAITHSDTTQAGDSSRTQATADWLVIRLVDDDNHTYDTRAIAPHDLGAFNALAQEVTEGALWWVADEAAWHSEYLPMS